MELLLQVWHTAAVENVCCSNDVSDRLDPVEQHPHHLDQEDQQEKGDEDEVDRVEGGVGHCRRRCCAIEG